MPQSKETLTGVRTLLSDLLTCCTMWIHVRQDARDASHVPCPCWVILGAAGCCWLGAGLGAAGAAGCCLVGEKCAGTVCSDRGPCEAVPWPHHMNWVLTAAYCQHQIARFATLATCWACRQVDGFAQALCEAFLADRSWRHDVKLCQDISKSWRLVGATIPKSPFSYLFKVDESWWIMII